MEAKANQDRVQGAGITVNVAFTSFPVEPSWPNVQTFQTGISQGEIMIEHRPCDQWLCAGNSEDAFD